MKLLVVGGGGREHAIIKKLKENPTVGTIYALPGNGGIAADAVCVPIRAADIDAICDFAAENGVDYAVVAPDDPLAAGCVDALTARGVPCFGPTKAAAEIESSKGFAKNLMRKYAFPRRITAFSPPRRRRRLISLPRRCPPSSRRTGSRSARASSSPRRAKRRCTPCAE